MKPVNRIPANCAYTSVVHPLALPPPADDTKPRPYSQLNSGTVVLNPSKTISESIVHFLSTHDKIAEFSFPDQDLLTAFFKGKWKPIAWFYNALRTLRYVHPLMWDDDEVRCVHYILPDKPWKSRFTPLELEDELGVTNKWWWDQFDRLAEELKPADPEGWKLVALNVDHTVLGT